MSERVDPSLGCYVRAVDMGSELDTYRDVARPVLYSSLGRFNISFVGVFDVWFGC